MAIENHISFDQREMYVERLRIPAQGRRQIGRSDTRQTVPPMPGYDGRTGVAFSDECSWSILSCPPPWAHVGGGRLSDIPGHSGAAFDSSAADAPTAKADRRGVFWHGLLVALTNPKTILFYAAFFPLILMPGPIVALVNKRHIEYAGDEWRRLGEMLAAYIPTFCIIAFQCADGGRLKAPPLDTTYSSVLLITCL